jgi:hypothetical protein
MMRNRWDATRLLAADKARASGSEDEAKRIMQFQFHAIRPKAASEIADISEARVSWALKRGITERVYRRVGAIAKPKVMEHFTFLRPIKNPVDLDLRGFRMWRPKPESNRRGRICNPI